MKIDPQYQKLILETKKDGEKFADKQMQTVYGAQKSQLDELHKYLGLLYVRHAADGLLNLTPSDRKAVLADADSRLTQMAKSLGTAEVKTAAEILQHNFSDTYYKNAYVMDTGLKAGIKFGLLKPEYINAAVNNPVDGEIFSDRIWNNKAAVADQVKQSIVNALNGDTTIDKIGQQIQRIFNVGAYESQRLINTENARVQSTAIDDIGKSAGCAQQMFCATLEGNTCSECAEYDGKYYDIDDDSKPDIPEHPNCRCCYINVPPVPGWSPLSRRDNETGSDIDYEDYAQWAADKGINNSEKSDSSGGESDIIWSDATFASDKLFDKHFTKHIDDFDGIDSKEAYLAEAQNLLSESNSNDVDGFISKDGFIFKYRRSTNEFAVGRPDGHISTLFKPDDGEEYWKEQIQLYKEKK